MNKHIKNIVTILPFVKFHELYKIQQEGTEL